MYLTYTAPVRILCIKLSGFLFLSEEERGGGKKERQRDLWKRFSVYNWISLCNRKTISWSKEVTRLGGTKCSFCSFFFKKTSTLFIAVYILILSTVLECFLCNYIFCTMKEYKTGFVNKSFSYGSFFLNGLSWHWSICFNSEEDWASMAKNPFAMNFYFECLIRRKFNWKKIWYLNVIDTPWLLLNDSI